MAVVNGTVHSVYTLQSDAVGTVQLAGILFTLSGTYAQADNAQLQNLDTLIGASRRDGFNGKAVSILGVALLQHATQQTDPSHFMSLKTVALSTTTATFEVTDNDETTELANGAVPTQDR